MVAEDSNFLRGQALRESNSLRNPDRRRPDGRRDADADTTTGWMHVGRTLGDDLTARDMRDRSCGDGLALRGMRERSGLGYGKTSRGRGRGMMSRGRGTV